MCINSHAVYVGSHGETHGLVATCTYAQMGWGGGEVWEVCKQLVVSLSDGQLGLLLLTTN